MEHSSETPIAKTINQKESNKESFPKVAFE